MGNQISDSTTISFLKFNNFSLTVSEILAKYGYKTSPFKDIISSIIMSNTSPTFQQTTNSFLKERLNPVNYNLFFNDNLLERNSTLSEKKLKDSDKIEFRFMELPIGLIDTSFQNKKLRLKVKYGEQYSFWIYADESYMVGDLIDFIVLLNEEDIKSGKIFNFKRITVGLMGESFSLAEEGKIQLDQENSNAPWCLINKFGFEYDRFSTFKQNDIQNGNELIFCKAKPLKIYFETSDLHKDSSLHYLDETIGEVISKFKSKNEFDNKVGIDLYYQDTSLETDKTIRNYFITDESVLRVLIKSNQNDF